MKNYYRRKEENLDFWGILFFIYVLAGEPLSAQQAEAAGRVAKIFRRDTIREETLKTAQQLASLPKVSSGSITALNYRSQTSMS